ncbi:MAG: hypothetical protein HS117_23955 [Verrucomicrobiaceae bacterium]|nr:hypothetical protein [Verrucomicrobiaceae bacterium]
MNQKIGVRLSMKNSGVFSCRGEERLWSLAHAFASRFGQDTPFEQFPVPFHIRGNCGEHAGIAQLPALLKVFQPLHIDQRSKARQPRQRLVKQPLVSPAKQGCRQNQRLRINDVSVR